MNLVWFKRDLRLHDHMPLLNALKHQQPCILLYIVEPSLLENPHYDIRHWRFVYESLQDLNQQLSRYGHQLTLIQGEAIDVIESLHKHHGLSHLFSHQEIGIDQTFRRDKRIKQWCQDNHVTWFESPHGAVVRGLKHRRHWQSHWHHYMTTPIKTLDLSQLVVKQSPLHQQEAFPETTRISAPCFQTGGETQAFATLSSFLQQRHRRYRTSISSPLQSREYCSRLSPYLAWGNLSLRWCYQTTQNAKSNGSAAGHINAFISRLHWHCHFIQKFESECRMELQPLNRGYTAFPYDASTLAEEKKQAWQQGKTGYPLVDACVRCLAETGYLNFRMRAMLVSFACHYLNIHWQDVAVFLAQQFLDFDPGIHYSQIHMQAGITGTNTIRIYNPIKQSQEQDPKGEFIKRWCPELASLSGELIHAPWKMAPLERQMFDLDYPQPIVDPESININRERLWQWRNKPEVQAEAQRILRMHVTPSSSTHNQARR